MGIIGAPHRVAPIIPADQEQDPKRADLLSGLSAEYAVYEKKRFAANDNFFRKQ